MLGLGHQLGALDIGGEHGLERGRGAARRFLGDVAEPRAARHFDLALVGFELADDDLHQRRLAGAVAADQPDLASRRDRSRGAVEDRTPAKAHRDSIDVSMAARLAANRGKPKTS
jgi:hypothetical protein